MANPSRLPNTSEQALDQYGGMAKAWRDFFIDLASRTDNAALQAQLIALAARVTALEDDDGGFSLQGLYPIQVFGTPAGGAVTIKFADATSDDVGHVMCWEGADGWVVGPYYSRIFEVTGGLLSPFIPGDEHAGKMLMFTNGGGGPVNIEIPASTTHEFPVGIEFTILNARPVGSVAISGEDVSVIFDQPAGVGLTFTDQFQQGVLKQIELDHWTLRGQVVGGMGVISVNSGTGTDVDNTDPINPIVNLDAGSIASLALADSAVQSVQPGTNVTIDNTDPQNPIVNATGGGSSPITTEGDLIVGDVAGAPDRLPIGATGEVLTSDGTTAAWAPPVTIVVTPAPFGVSFCDSTQSTKYDSGNRLVTGRKYFDPNDPAWGLSGSTVATLYMLLETTNAAFTADGDLYRESGAGSPVVVGTLTATASLTAVLLSVDISPAFQPGAVAGIFAARAWLTTADGTQQATCSGAWIEIIP